MAKCRIVFFQTESGRAPALEWMRTLEKTPVSRLQAVMEKLAEKGHALQRPHVAPLGEGISEIRARVGKVRYRLFFFRYGRNMVILSHGMIKKAGKVPAKEIDRALRHKALYEASPEIHTYGA